jgi:enoyl-[acyl-carrier-protein] reductase (NADH)
MDEQAVDKHAKNVADQAGSIDVSFNLITRGDAQGTPLAEMTKDDLLRAVVNALQSNFITARASGAGAQPGMGSTGPADAATETFMRYLAAELGPTESASAVFETLSKEKFAAVVGDMAPEPELVVQMIAGMAALRRAPRLADVAEAAAFIASDRAAGMTGSMANVTCGLVLR